MLKKQHLKNLKKQKKSTKLKNIKLQQQKLQLLQLQKLQLVTNFRSVSKFKGTDVVRLGPFFQIGRAHV